MSTEYIYELTAFFLEAASNCYAGSKAKQMIADLPKSKLYSYTKGDLLYLDTYFTNGENSGGQTIVYDNEVPVWLMQYQGWCKDDSSEVLDFLKEALQQSYTKGQWTNGRGPKEHTKFPLIYDNTYFHGLWEHTTEPGHFENFMGLELIRDMTNADDGNPFGERVFWHRYQGMLLTTP